MTEWTTIQNVVFPQRRVDEVLPLYLEAPTVGAPGGAVTVLSRESIRVESGRRVSSAAYFSAFPAAYWRHWTTVRDVRLHVTSSGGGRVILYRSDAHGDSVEVARRELSGESATAIDVPLESALSAGGWLWFDLEAHDGPLTLDAARWETPDAPARTGLASLAITTFNKPDYCVATLSTLAGSEAALGVLDRVFVVDQGDRLVADEEGFATAEAALGERLQVVRQRNLGGSGGFSRGMLETLGRPDSDFVLLLDDDVTLEPESVFRAVQFGRFARRPTIVGGHMFDFNHPLLLHAWAEIVERDRFTWSPVDRELVPHDFAAAGLRETPWMHERLDADYNGWWFCLIPVEAVRAVGLSLPVFIKWDDAEYGLRASEAGSATVTLPGAALWHVTWLDKDDTLDWQAYFHARNRTIAALLHSPHKRGGRFLADSRIWDLKHLLRMQYYPVAMRHRALRDVLAGPQRLHERLDTALADVREAAGDFPEKRVWAAGEAPEARRGRLEFDSASGRRPPKGPRGLRLALFTARQVSRHWFTAPSADARAHPGVELAARDATWFRTPRYDSVLVDASDDSGANWYVRDRRTFRRMLRESLRLHRALRRRWPTLAREYRGARDEMVSAESWKATLHPSSNTADHG